MSTEWEKFMERALANPEVRSAYEEAKARNDAADAYIGPESRCWECGGRIATRKSPDSDALGCEICYPDWPDMESPRRL